MTFDIKKAQAAVQLQFSSHVYSLVNISSVNAPLIRSAKTGQSDKSVNSACCMNVHLDTMNWVNKLLELPMRL